jgi:hypothetical protein
MLKYSLNVNDISGSTLNIPLSNLFSTETRQYDNIESLFDVNEMDVINPIIDLEKVKLSPVDHNTKTNEFDNVRFNLYFFINNDWSIPTNISDIGFTENDVKNRRNVLKNSFIRLSFFDSNDIKTQNLLFYSTIFFDTGKMYGQYITDTNIDSIYATFIVPNPKLSTGLEYLEGYNIYLFKDDIPTTGTTIYLKVEYNNAINGRTLLFTHTKPSTTQGYKLVDLKASMFLPITVNYNALTNKYSYSITGKNSNDLVFNCYQAKVQ